MQILESHWIQKLVSYECIHVGFSGGLDSTVLLHALASEAALHNKIHAVHINHGLSPEADAWEKQCQHFSKQLAIPCQTRRVSLNREANIEEEARNARYLAFSQLVKKNHCLVTAHHQDDQAETVLLHLFRGAGIKGLSGISATRLFSQGFLHRPFLAISRETLLTYATRHQLIWIHDESNVDPYFSRNFLRQQVLPLLKTKWPSVCKNLVRASELCREAQVNLDDLAEIDCPLLQALHNSTTSIELGCQELSVNQLMHLSDARLSNVLRWWLQKNAVRMPNYETLRRLFHEVIQADRDSSPEVRWGNWVVKRFHDRLSLHQVDLSLPLDTVQWLDFPNSLALPGIGTLSAQLAAEGIKLSPGSKLEIRFRQGGETLCWHGQTKSLKKLMQEWHIPPWSRSKIPLVYVNQQLAAVVGYAISDLFYSNNVLESYDIQLMMTFVFE